MKMQRQSTDDDLDNAALARTALLPYQMGRIII